MNVLSDKSKMYRAMIEIKKSRFIASIFYVEKEDEVKDKIKGLQKEFYDARHHVYEKQPLLSPVYKYSSSYDPETGWISFVGGGGYSGYNPSILAGEVAAQMGGYLNLIQTYENSFEHMDAYMLMTSGERLAMKMRNRYAAAGTDSNLMTYSPNQTCPNHTSTSINCRIH